MRTTLVLTTRIDKNDIFEVELTLHAFDRALVEFNQPPWQMARCLIREATIEKLDHEIRRACEILLSMLSQHDITLDRQPPTPQFIFNTYAILSNQVYQVIWQIENTFLVKTSKGERRFRQHITLLNLQDACQLIESMKFDLETLVNEGNAS